MSLSKTKSSSSSGEREPPGKRAIRFIEGACTHVKGELGGKPLLLAPYQREYIDELFGTIGSEGLRQYRTSLLALPRKCGKALAIDTPVLTTAGWSTMGDLRPGDYVFHPDGNPVRIAAVSEIMVGRPCYEVAFSQTQERIVADEQHLWKTKSVFETHAKVRTTLEIHQTLKCGARGDRRHSVEIPKPLVFDEAELPIHPYVLGAWLGNGNSQGSRITMHADDQAEMVNRLHSFGTPARPLNFSGNACTLSLSTGKKGRNRECLQFKLKEAGVFGSKRIPECYLRGSVSQRWDLLRGLMDTDGHIANNGVCEFSVVNESLARAAQELVASLGMKSMISVDDAKIAGRFISKRYRVRFKPIASEHAFYMKRKLEKTHGAGAIAPRSKTRQITECRPAQSVPVRCIQVESPDGMFLVGRSLIPTHNSTLCAAIALKCLIADDEPGAEVFSCGADRAQASIVFEVAKGMVAQSPILSKLCKVYRNAIAVQRTHSSYKALSADSYTKHGLNAHAIVFDELHTQKDSELWRVMSSSMGARRQPLLVAITTAGNRRESICYQIWQYAQQVRDGLIVDPTFLPRIYCADPEDDWTDPKVWAKANPGLGISVKLEELAAACAQAQRMNTEEMSFRQLRLNQWTNSATAWLRQTDFEACSGEISEDAHEREAFCGLDLSATFDTTSFVMVIPSKDKTEFDIIPTFWLPEDNIDAMERRDHVPYSAWVRAGLIKTTPGKSVDYETVIRDIIELSKTVKIKAISVDRWQSNMLSQKLIGEGLHVVQMGQGYGSLSAPSKFLEGLVVNRKIRHGGHQVYAWQASCAATLSDAAGNIKPAKDKSTGRIDSIAATVNALAAYLAGEEAEIELVWNIMAV